ncbi:glycosyl transferase [Permianibacter sp. IMCC34836]|nr:glycosyl transferase [Permianibacter fluminis]
MKILYGVQGTGNGHITRARALLPALRAAGCEVDVLVSGRPREELFGVESFGDFQLKQGLTFAMRHGHIDPLRTVLQAQPLTLLRDIRQLSLASYDLVISDFEPITAWAARRQGIPSLGIGHQYAFRHPIPKAGINIPSRLVLKYMAPVSEPVGLHWHGFGQPLLPPVLEPSTLAAPLTSLAPQPDKVLVYLPFEDTADLIRLFEPFRDHRFSIYCAVSAPEQRGHIRLCPFSRTGFKADLADCASIVTGAGFELPSEALVLGKKLLVRPLAAQFEQESNAKALAELGRARVMTRLDPAEVAALLAAPMPAPVAYPDVAAALARWIAAGRAAPLAQLAEQLWQQTRGLPRWRDEPLGVNPAAPDIPLV